MRGRSLFAVSVLLAGILAVPAAILLVDLDRTEASSHFRPHGPILIDGDSDFKRPNGVVSGRGTPADPYVIASWDISTTTADGILIRNTQAHFVIRDVLVHDGAASRSGIAFENVTFGRIENVTVSGGWFAGVRVVGSSYVSVEGSSFTRNDNGIQATEVRNLTLVRNGVFENGVGIGTNFTSRLIVIENAVRYNRYVGIYAGYATDLVIEGNDVYGHEFGGIGVEFSHGASIGRNSISNSTEGIGLWQSTNATIFANNVSFDVATGIWLGSSLGINVHHNTVVGNGIQAFDDFGRENAWDDGYPSGGNFWSDYPGVDRCSGPAQDLCPDPDGIGDAPYVIDRDSADRYPLMQPGGGGRASPLAFFLARHDRMTVTFDASRSEPRDAVPIVRYLWDFGDGTSAEGVSVVHPYAQPGRYEARLVVVDAEGRGGNATRFVSPSDSTVDVLVDSMFEANCPYADYWSLRTDTYGSVILQNSPPCSDFEPWVLFTSTPETNPSSIYALYRLDARIRNFYGYSVREPVLFPVLDPNASVDLSSGIRFDLSFGYLGPSLIESLRGTPYEVGPAFSDGFGYVLRGNVTMDLATSRRIFDVEAATPAEARAWWAANTAFARSQGSAEARYQAFLEAQGNGPYDIYNAFEWFFQADITDLNASVADDGTTNVRLFLSGWGLDVLLARWFYWGNATYADAVNQPFETAFPRGWMPMELCWCESATIQGTIQQSLNLDFEAVAAHHLRAWANPGSDGRLGTSDDVPRWVFEPQLMDTVPRRLSGYPNSELRWYEDLARVHGTPGSFAYGTPYEYIDVPARWKLDPGSSLTLVLPRSDVTWYDPVRSSWDPSARIGRYSTFRDGMTLGEVRPGGDYSLWDPLGKVLSVAGPHDWGTRGLPLEGAPWIEFVPEGVTPPPPPNTPPTAAFSVSPGVGNVTTVFTVDASASFDAEDPPDLLEVRWDWENDGSWDTSYGRDKVARHQYSRPSNYSIRLEVRDTGGLTSTTTRQILVLEDGGAGAWTPLAPFSTPRDAYGAAEVGGILYYVAGYSFAGDTTVLEAYDPTLDAWTPRASLPASPRSFTAAVSDGRYLYLVGGRPSEIVGRELWRYDPHGDAWTALAPMPTARATSYMAAYADGRIYVVGGRTVAWPIGDALSALEVYDIAANRWSSGPPLPEARAEATAIAHAGRLFVFGGHDAFGAIRDTTFVYDIAEQRWSVGPAMPEARWIALTGRCGDTLHVIGGATRDFLLQTSNFAFDVNNMGWSLAAPIPRPSIAVQAVSYASRIHVVAGGAFAPGGPPAHYAFECPIPEEPGFLFVRTALDLRPDAFVPGTILVDGTPRDVGALFGLRVHPGRHRVEFTDVPGLGTPAEVVVDVAAGQAVDVLGTYLEYGRLRVRTDPALPATISVDDVPRNDWSLDLALPPGVYTVSFGGVQGFQRPAAVTVRIEPDATTEVVGTYERDDVSPGPDPASYGLLRVRTVAGNATAGVPTRIVVDGLVRDEWGLAWLKLPPGDHLVAFTDVPGLGTAPSQRVTIVAGRTTEVVGLFEVHGYLRVRTEPPTPASISVDGIPRNAWGIWLDVRAGLHEVSFGPAPGLVTPPPRTVRVVGGELSETNGTYDVGRPPVAAFSILAVDSLNRTVTVDASASSDPNGDITSYTWDWGDGLSTERTTPLAHHAYAADGRYTITLTVADATGLDGTASLVVDIDQPDVPPTAAFSVSSSQLTVFVDGSLSKDPNGDIVSYAWDWGDGTSSGPSDPRANHTYGSVGSYLITLTVTDSVGLRDSESHLIQVALTSIAYQFRDFFNVPYGEHWDIRQLLYFERPINAECFNERSIADGTCVADDPSVPDVATYPYVNWWSNGVPGHPNATSFVYAPYRLSATGLNVPGYNVSEPVFLPVLNYAQPPGRFLEVDWRFTYINNSRAAEISVECVPNIVLYNDGYIIENSITLRMDFQESKRIFGVVASDPASGQRWWDANTNPSCRPPNHVETGPLEQAVADWFVRMGGSLATPGKYDIAAGFAWFYQIFAINVVAMVDPGTGDTTVRILQVAYGTEILLARMFYWGNVSYLANYLDSTKAAGWNGMEGGWFDDFAFSARLEASDMSFGLNAVVQYHFAHQCAPGPNGRFDRLDDVPYWTWGPQLADYVRDFSPSHTASELDRYPSATYVHCSPGSPTYGRALAYDYVPILWDLAAGESWTFEFPANPVIFFDPNLTPIPADPANQFVPIFASFELLGTTPSGYGLLEYGPERIVWSVVGPATTGGPSGSPGPDGVPGTADDMYPLEPWGAIRLRPGASGNRTAGPVDLPNAAGGSGPRATMGSERLAVSRPSHRRLAP